MPAAVDHWRYFGEFVEHELAAGGPDPHMRYVGALTAFDREEERWWRLGVYVAVYNTASAEVLWQHWSWALALAYPEKLEQWLTVNWKGLRTRRERRAVRTPKKLTACLHGYAKWLASLPLRNLTSYEDWWAASAEIPYFGRYARFKLLEVLHRYAGLAPVLSDIRARGGWSPRLTLALLAPMLHDAKLDHPVALAEAECVAAEVRAKLTERTGLELDFYRFEVMLCDYRQSYEGGRQYPGRSVDSELEYYAAIAPYWYSTYRSGLFPIRAAQNPAEHLGELQGWTGVRKELGGMLKVHGTTWSDLLFDYAKTTDLAAPVRRGNGADVRLHLLARETLGAR